MPFEPSKSGSEQSPAEKGGGIFSLKMPGAPQVSKPGKLASPADKSGDDQIAKTKAGSSSEPPVRTD